MATNYPSSLDSLSNPATTDPVNNPSHAVQHANANDAIEALQAKVGADNSLITTSIDYRVRQLESNPVGTANKITQLIINNTGSTLAKGKAVYASGSVGASGQLRVSLSSNATEATSSKTFGVLAESVTNGGQGTVVTEGLLENIDTSGANDGDPIWLGTNGGLIFGLANKPYAPAHLVFIGTVVRGGNVNNGSIFVKVQNGFELEELHNVAIASLADKDLVAYDNATGLWKNKTFNTLGLATQTYVDTAVQNLSNASDLEYVPIADVGAADGVAPLDSGGKIPDSYIPSGITRDTELSAAIANLVNSAPSTLDTLSEIATALGNDANLSTTLTNAIAGKVSKSGGDTITTSGTSVKGLIIKGISTSQTANLQEWQNSAGNTLAYITPYGGFYNSGGTRLAANAEINGYGAAVTIDSGVSSYPMLVIKGAASQTANLQEWKNSSSTTLTKVDASGNLYFINPTANNNANDTPSQSINFQGNLWNSALGNVNMKGAIKVAAYSANANPTISKMSFLLATDNGTPSEVASFTNTGAFSNIGGLDSYGSGVIFRLRNTTTATPDIVIPSPKLELMGRAWNSDQGSAPSRAYLQVNANNNNTNPFINRLGFFVATGNNDGGWNYGTDATEYMSILGNGRVGINSNSPSATLDIRNISSSATGLIVRGLSSQTANLQEWQDNSGNVLAKIAADGKLTVGYGAGGGIAIGSASFGGITYNGISNPSGVTSYPTLVIKGITSQTADLQQWQNSGGTTIVSIDPNGTIVTRPVPFAGNQNRTIIGVTDVGNNWTQGSFRFITDSNGFPRFGFNAPNSAAECLTLSGNSIGINTPAPEAQLHITANGSAFKGLIVKGTNIQTANLQEWQNGAGTVLARVASDGAFYAGGMSVYTNGNVNISNTLAVSYIEGRYINTFGGYQLANQVPVTIKGVSSQTANLTEWQNSSGTVLAKIDSNGFFTNTYGANLSTASVSPVAGVSVFIGGQSGAVANTILKNSSAATYDFIQFRDSTNTVLAKVDASGKFVGDGSLLTGISGGLTVASVSSNITLQASYRYFVDTTAARTLTLPASPALGTEIQILDASGTAGTYNITVSRNGNLINGNAGNLLIDTNGGWYTLVYTGSTYGWKVG